jgi:ribosomal subunit interface protein
MHIEVNASDVQTSQAIIDHVHAEVEKAMRFFRERTTRVEVHLKDLNSNKGGQDKRCLMEARLAGQNPIAIEHEAADLYLAISGAADKLHRAVQKKIDRLDTRTSA